MFFMTDFHFITWKVVANKQIQKRKLQKFHHIAKKASFFKHAQAMDEAN